MVPANPAFRLPEGADHPVLRQAFAYWASKVPPGTSPGTLPGRQHIDPVEMRDFLPHLVLFEVDRSSGTPRFRFAVQGTKAVAAFGRDSTGKYIDELDRAPYGAAAVERLHRIVEGRQPAYTKDRIAVPKREYVVLRRLALPLARDGATVDNILMCFVVEKNDGS